MPILKPLTSAAQLIPGVDLDQVSDFRRAQRNESLYLGNRDPLISGIVATLGNGLKRLDFDLAPYVNLFALATDFYRDAVLSERPQVSRPLTDQQWRIVSQTVVNMLWGGYGVIQIRRTGIMAPVSPLDYIPIFAPWDLTFVESHVIAYRYAEGGDVINRVRLIVVEIGGTYEELYELDGTILGKRLEDEPMPSDVAKLIVVGDGIDAGFYNDLIPIARELTIREGYGAYILNRNASPVMLVPPTAGLLQQGGAVIEDPRERETYQTKEPGDYGYLTWDGNLSDNAESIARQWLAYHLTTRIPPQITGIDIGKGESGVAREKLLLAAQAYIRELRLSVARVIVELVPGAEVTWLTSPLHTLDDRNNQIRADVQAGILSLERAEELIYG